MDHEDLIIWPDDTQCFAYELHEYTHKSDDYERVSVDDPRYAELVDNG